jgi:alpha-glucosidase
LGQPALYVRANTSIPMGPDASYTGERPTDPLTLLLYPAPGDGKSMLYEDAGNGFGYAEGEYARRTISCESSEDRIAIRVGEREGTFVPERSEIRIELPGVTVARSVLVDGEERGPEYGEDGALTVSLGEGTGSKTVEVIL